MANTSGDRYSHRPVMLDEVLGLLDLRPGKVVVDCTVGGGGHAREIIKRIIPEGFLIGIDKDGEVLKDTRGLLLADLLAGSGANLEPTNGEPVPTERNLSFYHTDYLNLGDVLEEAGKGGVDGVLLDLGVSSIQLDIPERGFSFMREGPLDMRMDRSSNLTACDILKDISLNELEDILRRFGEERWSRRIAAAIIRERRRSGCIKTTSQLARVVESAVHPSRRKIHPATLTFQAIRIVVNSELESLERFLSNVHLHLNKGGRIVVISFHSLEDRIVKNSFRQRAREGVFRILTPKPLRASRDEVRLNPRARSAKLRASERI